MRCQLTSECCEIHSYPISTPLIPTRMFEKNDRRSSTIDLLASPSRINMVSSRAITNDLVRAFSVVLSPTARWVPWPCGVSHPTHHHSACDFSVPLTLVWWKVVEVDVEIVSPGARSPGPGPGPTKNMCTLGHLDFKQHNKNS